MPPSTASQQTVSDTEIRADELRSRMFADRDFMAGIRAGWEEGLRGEGMTVEEYLKTRDIR
jgi:hypothetical protein